MSYETVVCEVRWIATISYLDSSGTYSQKVERLGEFESKEAAENALKESDMVLSKALYPHLSCEWTHKNTSFIIGDVKRILVEKKT